jgi:hypothetical protein
MPTGTKPVSFARVDDLPVVDATVDAACGIAPVCVAAAYAAASSCAIVGVDAATAVTPLARSAVTSDNGSDTDVTRLARANLSVVQVSRSHTSITQHAQRFP